MVENPKDGEVYWSISTRDGDDYLVTPVLPWSGKLKTTNPVIGAGWLCPGECQTWGGPCLYCDDLYATEAEAWAAYNVEAIRTAEHLERQAKELRESVFHEEEFGGSGLSMAKMKELEAEEES